MYVIAIIIFLVATVGGISLCSPPIIFLDIPSLLIILLFTIPMLIAAGLGGDLSRAFKVMVRKDLPYTRVELQRALIAVEYTMRLLFYAGLIGSLIGFISMLRNISDLSTIGPNFAVMLLTLFYALLASFFFLPIRAKIKALLVVEES
ncbi:MAG: hypothetical protein K0S04_1428 [Herbinix sp.]|jgi:flagellar motor component MotA|nr:hypothetical protein [Herbinix sp.]